MKIEKVFKTSKGLFWSLEEAEKKANRQKDTDPRSSTYRKYEAIQCCHVLVSDQGAVFELKEASVA